MHLHSDLLNYHRIEEKDELYGSNGKNLVLEYFLPINLPNYIELERKREKRDVEGSGDDEGGVVFYDTSAGGNGGVGGGDFEIKNNEWNNTIDSISSEVVNKTANNNVTDFEGSGEIGDVRDNNDNIETSNIPLINDSEIIITTTEEEEEGKHDLETSTIVDDGFVKSNESMNKTEEEITEETKEVDVTTTTETSSTLPSKVDEEDEVKTEKENETSTVLPLEFGEKTESETYTPEPDKETTTTMSTITEIYVSRDHHSQVFAIPDIPQTENDTTESTTSEGTTEKTLEVTVLPHAETTFAVKEEPVPITTTTTTMKTETETEIPTATEIPYIETKFAHNTIEATPGNVLHKKNLTPGVDPLLVITNTGAIESDDGNSENSQDSRKLGAYIVIGLILLSFSTLVGYITFKKLKNRKRKSFENHKETNDTEKALLSLNDYKDNSELEENHLKNNEITPIVVKSQNQRNKFEKNTNFSSPKNLNMITNEKNVEKDNVLKSTTDNLTQVIIEDTLKDVDNNEENKNSFFDPEKVIVKTRIVEDSIPKKPILINRSSSGYIPIPQDNV
ncbi:conserved hypothetical protein [Pediculus humanus corporis]|uniref:Uncharacterized protein n=1 Tax=Pediculus humanus subsp. corporis TaxID=121224 RepID=E0VXM3_PEDHC|nr:uncharacterized protein Phum_PHUM502750 [Pediculus humanus corporis]EEB18129.1 conserved hypothetical protein [Pediculus humanus corporis]